MVDCIACGKAITEKDTIGINKKMLGENIRNYYCLDFWIRSKNSRRKAVPCSNEVKK